ncbi:MAG: AtpZ/AtpI family protein [Lentisphaerae bacterium]|nr:AtpZ/AtpI family protein [Lentisphaerota bacterium]
MSAKGKQIGKQGEAFLSEVQKRRELHEAHEREGNTSFWRSGGVMGTIGWTVSIPMLGGLFLGRWIDNRLDSTHVFMLFCMLVGLIVGCVTAWRVVSARL